MRVRIAGLFVCVVVLVAPNLSATETEPTYGETFAKEIEAPNLVWVPGIEDGQFIPQPPPFSLLYLEDPMPNSPEQFPEFDPTAIHGNGVLYDAITGKEVEVPYSPPERSRPQQGGAYSGALPLLTDEVSIKSFANMTQVADTAAAPWRMNVKLLMRFEDNVGADRWFVCSGTMKDAEVVLTAGHCVYSRDADIMSWAQEIWVYPGWEGVGSYSSRPVEPLGYGHGTIFGSWTGWTGSGDLDSDFGMVRITRAVGMLTGWFGYKWGSDCAWHQAKNYNNASYPSENCPLSGLHNGLDMYYWYGTVDACPGNQLQLWTGGGNCFDTVWGGMSGSGMYYIDTNRYVHAICSTSNRDTWGNYVRQTEAWINYMYDSFIPGSRGTTFDLQALDSNFEPSTITAGNPTTLSNFFSTNPTNGTANSTWHPKIYLSTNDYLSTGDTLLSSQSYSYNYAAMSSVRVNLVHPTIPYNTPSGTYWLGVIFDAGDDTNSSNNDTSYWDATEITVAGVNDLEADYVLAPSGIFAPGQTFSVSYHATNIGGDTSNPVTVEIRASTNTIISTLDDLIGTVSHSGVSGGAALSGGTSVSFPAAMADRTYYIGLRVVTTGDANGLNNTAFDATPLMLFRGMFYDGFESGSVSQWSTSMP